MVADRHIWGILSSPAAETGSACCMGRQYKKMVVENTQCRHVTEAAVCACERRCVCR